MCINNMGKENSPNTEKLTTEMVEHEIEKSKQETNIGVLGGDNGKGEETINIKIIDRL